MTDRQLPEADGPEHDGGRRRRRTVALAVVVVLLVAGIAGVVWLLSSDAPEAVDISNAVGQVGTSERAAAADTASETTATGDTATTGTGATGDAASGVGVWVVDTSIGEVSIPESTGTFVGLRVDEELANVGAATAVMRTPEVDGTIELDGTTLTTAGVEADFTAMVSDESRRDDAIQRALNTAEYPTATFMLTEPVELDALPTAGEPVEATATGDLTINGVTNSVDVPLQVAMVDDVAVVTGTFDITFADYDVDAPTAPIVLSVDDSGTVELQLFLTPEA